MSEGGDRRRSGRIAANPVDPSTYSRDTNDPELLDDRRQSKQGRQSKKGSKAKPRKKNDKTRAQSDLPLESSDDAGDPQTNLLPIDLPTSDITRNINRWNKVKDKLKVTKDIEVTQAPRNLRAWDEREIQYDRDYEVVEVVKVESIRTRFEPGKKTVRLNSNNKRIEEPVESWAIYVHDKNRPRSDRIGLYLPHRAESKHAKTTESRGGPLETHFCDEEAAWRVGRQACQRMNRLKDKISVAIWNGESSREEAVRLKRLVEAASMSAISPTFDYSAVDTTWVGNLKSGGSYTNYGMPVHEVSPLQENTANTGLRWRANTYSCDGLLFRLSFCPHHLDDKLIKEELEGEVPDWFFWKVKSVDDVEKDNRKARKATSSRPTATQSQLEAAMLLTQWFQYKMFTSDFEHAAANTFMSRHIEKYRLGSRMQPTGNGGPCGGYPGWGFDRNSTPGGVHITPYERTSKLVEGGELPSIFVASRDGVLLAYVLQAMYLVLASGRGLLNAWQAGCIAADIVNAFMPDVVDRATILHSHCLCDSVEESQQVSHYCMHDFRYVRCCDAVKLADGRLVCRECVLEAVEFANTPVLGSANRFTRYMTMAAFQNVLHDCQSRGQKMDHDLFKATRAQLLTHIAGQKEGFWLDGWDGLRDLAHTLYEDVGLQAVAGYHHMTSHYLIPSLDAIYAYLVANNIVYNHHPSNVVATALALNFLRGVHIPSVLYWMRLAREHWLEEKAGDPPNHSFWTAFHNAMDHAMLIRKLTYFSKAKRLNQEPDLEKMAALRTCYKTGEFSGTTVSPPFITIASVLGTASENNRRIRRGEIGDKAYADWADRGGRKYWEPWNDADWELISDRHEDIRTSPVHNPDGHAMPLGPGNTPYGFLEAHMPKETSPTEFRKFMCNTFRTLWQRMDEVCNWAHESRNNPLTLFLTFIKIWYKTGGKDEMFGCQMTFYESNMCTVSLGRRAETYPGAVMHDGWTSERPTSLDDYVDDERTLTFQTGAANRFSFNFPQSYLEELPDLLLTVKESTDYYDPPNMNLPAIDMPKDIAKLNFKSYHRDPPPEDDFLGYVNGQQREEDEMSESDPDADRVPLTFESELDRFWRRKEREEGLRFNKPALALLERASAESEADEDDALDTVVNGLSARRIIPLAKVAKDGQDAWTHDEMNDWLVQRGIQGADLPGTVAMAANASDCLECIERGYDTYLEWGNPFMQTTASGAIGEITRAVMVWCSGNHYVVLDFNFDGPDNRGIIRYWNSLRDFGTRRKGSIARADQHAFTFAKFLASQPQVNRPDLFWDTLVIEEHQTQQHGNVDCGPLSINTAIDVLLGNEVRIYTGRERDQFVQDLRYKFMDWAFQQFMGEDSMAAYVERRDAEDAHLQAEAEDTYYFQDTWDQLYTQLNASGEQNSDDEQPGLTEDERQRRREEEAKRKAVEREAKKKAEEEKKRAEEEEARRAEGGGHDDANMPTHGIETRLTSIETKTLSIEGEIRNIHTIFGRLDKSFEKLTNDMTGGFGEIKKILGNEPSGRRQPDSSNQSGLRLITRTRYDRDVMQAVAPDHPAYHFAVVTGTGNNRQFGYPATGGFFTIRGAELARFDGQGRVFDMTSRDAFVGNFMDDLDE